MKGDRARLFHHSPAEWALEAPPTPPPLVWLWVDVFIVNIHTSPECLEIVLGDTSVKIS